MISQHQDPGHKIKTPSYSCEVRLSHSRPRTNEVSVNSRRCTMQAVVISAYSVPQAGYHVN